MNKCQLVLIRAEKIDTLRSLVKAAHAERVVRSPALAPFLAPSAAWEARRAVYLALLQSGGCILADQFGAEIAAYCAITPLRIPWTATFETGEWVGEDISLFVEPAQRNRRIGSMLLDESKRFLADRHIKDMLIGQIPNEAAGRSFAERRGFVPAWLTLRRLGGAAGPASQGPDSNVRPVSASGVASLRSTWLTLHHHHQAVSPHLAPFVSDDRSWQVFERIFLEVAQNGLLLAVGNISDPAGLLSARITEGKSLFPEIWPGGDSFAEIEVSVVQPGMRGNRIGQALMGEVDALLWARGISEQIVGAIAPNRDAIRFYERRGFQPAWLELTRFRTRRNCG